VDLGDIEQAVKKGFPKNIRLFPLSARAAIISQVIHATQSLWQAYYRGSKVVIVGIGSSSSQAQHLADELVGSAKLQAKPLAALTLTTNVARTVQALIQPFDVVFAISAEEKGIDEIRRALDVAKSKDCFTIGLLSNKSSPLADLVQVPIIVPGRKVNRIRERHGQIIQVIADISQGMR